MSTCWARMTTCEQWRSKRNRCLLPSIPLLKFWKEISRYRLSNKHSLWVNNQRISWVPRQEIFQRDHPCCSNSNRWKSLLSLLKCLHLNLSLKKRIRISLSQSQPSSHPGIHPSIHPSPQPSNLNTIQCIQPSSHPNILIPLCKIPSHPSIHPYSPLNHSTQFKIHPNSHLRTYQYKAKLIKKKKWSRVQERLPPRKVNQFSQNGSGVQPLLPSKKLYSSLILNHK